MIIKVLTRNSPSYKSLINYIYKGSLDKNNSPNILKYNLRATTIEEYVNEYILNESFRKHNRKNKTYLYHEIVSLSSNENKEVISDEMLNDLAHKYIELRGNKGIYFGGIHKEKNNIHFHFCVGGTEFRTGKAFRLSKSDLLNLKQKFQEYHQLKYPELTHSSVQHGQNKKYVTDREWQAVHRNERGLAKKEVQDIVQACYAKAYTQKEFLELLRENNLHFYERNGQPAGIIYNDLKIRFSRIGVGRDQLESLRLDRSEEERALQSIQSLRQRIISKTRNEKEYSYER